MNPDIQAALDALSARVAAIEPQVLPIAAIAPLPLVIVNLENAITELRGRIVALEAIDILEAKLVAARAALLAAHA